MVDRPLDIVAVIFGLLGMGLVIAEAVGCRISRGVPTARRWMGLLSYSFPGLVFGIIVLDRTRGPARVLGLLGCLGLVVLGVLVHIRSRRNSDVPVVRVPLLPTLMLVCGALLLGGVWVWNELLPWPLAVAGLILTASGGVLAHRSLANPRPSSPGR